MVVRRGAPLFVAMLALALPGASALLGPTGPAPAEDSATQTVAAGCAARFERFATVHASDPPALDDCARTFQTWTPVRSTLTCHAPNDLAECRMWMNEWNEDRTQSVGSVFVDCGPLGPEEPQVTAQFVGTWSTPAQTNCFTLFSGEYVTTWDNWDARCRGGQWLVCTHLRA